jgi:hypothetical protein
MSMILDCTERYLFKYNGSWVVSIKQNMNFNFQSPAILVFLDFRGSDLLNSCSFSEYLLAYEI